MTLLEVAMDGAYSVGRTFTSPDDDWKPILMYRKGDEPAKMTMLLGYGNKDRAAENMQEAIWKSQATEAVFLSSAWMVTADRDDLGEFERGERHARSEADRKECLILTYVDRDSVTASVAVIQRHPLDPPTLGEFTPVATGLDVSGRFVDAIRAGFR